MKTKEELSAIKKEVETLSQKLSELTDEELAEVIGGTTDVTDCVFNENFASSGGSDIKMDIKTDFKIDSCTFQRPDNQNPYGGTIIPNNIKSD